MRIGAAGMLFLAGVLGMRTSAGAECAEMTAQQKARQEAIRKSLAAIEAELQKYGGGSWEEWGRKLAPFRDAVNRKVAPKHGLRIRADEWRFIVLDKIDNEPAEEAIVHFDRQLKARGIDLIVVPIPGKLSIYPDFICPEVGCDRLVAVAAKRMMKTLLECDVEVVDLFTVYRDRRLATNDKPPLYYYHEDSHWRNLAAQIAGERIADRLKRCEVVGKTLAAGNRYTTKVEERIKKSNADTILSVYDAKTNAYHPDEPGTRESPFILTGDSYSKYNCGQGAHLPAQVARLVGLPLTYDSTSGLSAEVPRDTARKEQQGNFLAGRSAFVWTFAWMSLQGRKDWAKVDLPKR